LQSGSSSSSAVISVVMRRDWVMVTSWSRGRW